MPYGCLSGRIEERQESGEMPFTPYKSINSTNRRQIKSIVFGSNERKTIFPYAEK